MAYHPPQRAVATLCFTGSRWIRGTFHLAEAHGFDEHLRKLRTFFPLTEVDLGSGSMPFLAMRASAIHAVAPLVREGELLLSPAPGTTTRAVSCYLDGLALHGELDMVPGVRTSDFLGMHQDGFIPLRACRAVPPVPGIVEPIPVLFVSSRAIIAVAEEEPAPAPR